MVEFVFSQITGQVFIVSQILIVIAAVVLVGITTKAYVTSKLKKMIYVIIAFALTAIIYTINVIDQAVVDIMPDDVRYAMFGVVHLTVMGMFFLAIIKK